MQAIRKILFAGAVALMIPLSAGTASAAAVATPGLDKPALTGSTVIADTGLAKQRLAVKENTIVEARRRRRGRAFRGLAAGIIAGAAAAAIISGASRAHGRPYRSRRYDRCERWYYRCEDGVRRACRKYYRYCD